MSAFANGYEWDCWAANWCHRCAHEENCPLLDEMFLGDVTPAAWTPGTDDLADRYHCPQYELALPVPSGIRKRRAHKETPVVAHPLTNLSTLDRYKAAPLPPGYPANQRTFYSPADDVHGALLALLQSATTSLIVAMYAFDDAQLADTLREKLLAENVYVQLTLDAGQAASPHEHAILAQRNYPAASIAVGESEHGAPMHLKLVIVDGTFVITGSTNWSGSAEVRQDNQLTVTADAVVAAEARARVDAIHAHMIAANAKATP